MKSLLSISILACIFAANTFAIEQDFHYENGLSAFQNNDFEGARLEWLLAAEKAHPTAQFNLGLLFSEGKGVKQDWDEAYNWFIQSAKSGHDLARFSLGIMYFNGQGVEQDYSRAYLWAGLAAQLGNESGRKLRDAAAKKLNSEQLSVAQNLLVKCIAQELNEC
ncbi:sel1 repeat family protein [Litorivicinus sp.]|nr:sel1 repeat family protein [Litorivicinus sp.]